ncbi:MAG TPA: VWA domain-containing protein, partial [Methanoculleus sp.]|uniref:Ig-like domain-containing protein n=3 Tax=Methanoculleus TaxID=45989 RepID=UPI002C901C7A|nr:VWA domain-containing protein [Methanoculleus sp.]
DLSMNFQKIIILTILLGLIVPAVGAADPGRIVLSSDIGWLVANGADSSGITVQVLDGDGASLPNCTVALDVDPIYGRLAPATVTTGASGTAVTTFTVNKTSGVAVITARAGAVEETLSLSIDHDLPSRIVYLHYDSEVTAGNTTTITVGVADRHGNPVDDRRVAETVRFSAGSVDDDAVFIDDGGSPVPVLERSTNVTGFVRAEFRTGRTVGENIVRMTVLPAGVDRYISIRGLPTGLPAAIDVSVSPDADPIPYRSANGEDTFTLTYRLFDAWGNPAAGRGLQVNTSLGENAVLTTNGTGIACLTYGPKDTTGRITITVTTVDNASVTSSETVEFIHTDPVDMLLSANPQSMPSRDVNRDSISELRAKVMDIKGNPVADETVTFEIVPGSVNVGGYTKIQDPALTTTSAETDEYGYATVEFQPGTFAGPKENGWDATAKGTATVRATWRDLSRDILLTWMNYPYLSVEASVSNQTVAVNNTTEVTIRLKGDGYALQPDPIDVVLCTDRSGSMLYDNPDRMHSVREAAKEFVDSMSERDKVGLVTFGRNTGSRNQIDVPGESSFTNPWNYIDNDYSTPKRYRDYATVDLPLIDTLSSVKTELNNIVPDYGTPMRGGTYRAINELSVNGSSDAVKAIVLLSDGDYNWYGDPLARGNGYPSSWYGPTAYGDLVQDYYMFDGLLDAEQNLSVYARHKNVTIYSIGYADSISPGGRAALKTLAESTGGKYYNGTAANIGAVYTAIAGDLKTEAGVDTTMTLDFGTIRVNDEDREGEAVFTYVHEDGISTTIESWVENDTGRHEITPFTTINQTDDWNDDHALQFEIGTVHLDQVWEATFRLRVLTDGNINVFGPGSTITFNDGAELALPDTFITAVPDLANTGLGSATLTLANPRYTCTEPVLEFLTAAWDLAYTGSGSVTQVVEYSNDGGLSWVQFDTPTSGASSLDVRNRPPGEYRIRVRASADDAPDAGVIFPPIRVGEWQNAYIRLA